LYPVDLYHITSCSCASCLYCSPAHSRSHLASCHTLMTDSIITLALGVSIWGKLSASQCSCCFTLDYTSTGKRITSLTIALIHSALTHATLVSSITSQDRNQQITCLVGITHYSVMFVHSCSQHLNLKSSCLNWYPITYLAACSCLPDLAYHNAFNNLVGNNSGNHTVPPWTIQ
jgi:hypothetical protein